MSETRDQDGLSASQAEYYGKQPIPVDEVPAGADATDMSAEEAHGGDGAAADIVDTSKKGFFAYFRTKEFYIVLLLG